MSDQDTTVSVKLNPNNPLVNRLIAEAVAEYNGDPDAQSVADMMMATLIMAGIVGLDLDGLPAMIQAGEENAMLAVDHLASLVDQNE